MGHQKLPMKVKSILVSQPKPQTENHPYMQLASKHKIDVDFRSFIEVREVEASEFRKDKINPKLFTSFIFTSRNAVDHFFRLCKEMRVEINPEWKYFCTSEAVAFYLQKFVPYRKRKIYPGKGHLADLIPIMKRQRNQKFLLPTSNLLKPSIPEQLDKAGLNWTRAVMFNTVSSDLSDLEDVTYDVLVFFSPEGIRSLYTNFPDFEQNRTRIAAFGTTTKKAIEEHELRLDIAVPTEEYRSMTEALDAYVTKANKDK